MQYLLTSMQNRGRGPWVSVIISGQALSVRVFIVSLSPLACPAQEDDGKSQAPVFQSDMPGVKVAAFSQLPKCGKNQTDMTGCEYTDKHKIDYMGYSIRTDLYRYTEWFRWNGTALRADLSFTMARELYDHVADVGIDFNAYENENIVMEQLVTMEELSGQLRNFIRSQYDNNDVETRAADTV
eukprot:scpid6675/ scgid1424/ 